MVKMRHLIVLIPFRKDLELAKKPFKGWEDFPEGTAFSKKDRIISDAI